MKNHSTIVYTMNKPNFKYHISKGELKRGSTISKKVHPLKEVNQFRDKLLERKIILDNGKNYILNDTIKIGAVMAYNLHCGELKSEIESNNDIVINRFDKAIIEEFNIKNIYSTDAKLRNSLILDSMKLSKLYEIEVDFSVVSEQKPDEFSKLEKMFSNVLIQEKIIDINSRHGLTQKNECDIVDEKHEIQVEIVTEFKNRLKKDKTPQKNIDMFMIEAIDNNLIKTSDALMKKFLYKSYTSDYQIELGIFCIGEQKSISTMLKVLQGNLENNNIKNNFKNIYIIWYDFILDEYYFYSSRNKDIKKLKNQSLGLVKKKPISFKNMEDGKKYLIVLKNIFKEECALSYLSKTDIIKLVKQLRIII